MKHTTEIRFRRGDGAELIVNEGSAAAEACRAAGFELVDDVPPASDAQPPEGDNPPAPAAKKTEPKGKGK